MPDQVLPHVAPGAREELEDARRQTRLGEQRGEARAQDGGQAGGFEQRDVARHDGRGDHAGGDRQREIPGRDDEADPARLIPIEIVLAGQIAQAPDAAQPPHLAGVVFEK
jgi:hypothetical protein